VGVFSEHSVLAITGITVVREQRPRYCGRQQYTNVRAHNNLSSSSVIWDHRGWFSASILLISSRYGSSSHYPSIDVAVVRPPACRLRLLRCVVVVVRSDNLYGRKQNTCRYVTQIITSQSHLWELVPSSLYLRTVYDCFQCFDIIGLTSWRQLLTHTYCCTETVRDFYKVRSCADHQLCNPGLLEPGFTSGVLVVASRSMGTKSVLVQRRYSAGVHCQPPCPLKVSGCDPARRVYE